ncbi:MAG: hypothetical protein IJV66_00690 [Firmicutes bacterium]|nr:hypothetical protein [Bacillota bacterium]
MSKRNSNKLTFKIAMGGIFLALTVIFLCGAAFVPGIELTLFACASFFTAFMLLETGTGGALLLYAAASILGFFLLPNKLAIVPYVFLFGYYGILKFYIEKLRTAKAQIAVKVIFFAGILTLGLTVFFKTLASGISLPDYPAPVLIIAGTLLMILYDFIYTYVINFYCARIRAMI